MITSQDDTATGKGYNSPLRLVASCHAGIWLIVTHYDLFFFLAGQDYNPVQSFISASSRMCLEVVTIDNNFTEPNKNFTISLMFLSFVLSRTFNTDISSITVEIVDNDGEKVDYDVNFYLHSCWSI